MQKIENMNDEINLTQLNYPINYRDIGRSVNNLMKRKILKENKLFRSGSVENVKFPYQIGYARTIINFRSHEDDLQFDCVQIHLPLSNTLKYDVQVLSVQQWLNNFFLILQNEKTKFPLLIHCLQGCDRTGVATAMLLKILDIPINVIILEYGLSEFSCEDKNKISETLKYSNDFIHLMDKAVIDSISRKLKY